MGMNVGQGNDSGEPEVMIDINTTPLIDVMLVLLIMLIITIPMQTHAVKLDMPSSSAPPPGAPPPAINLEIDFDGTFLWDGVVIPDRASLDQHLLAEAHAAEPAELHIRPDKLVEYKYVAEVLASAQRLGITQIGLVGNEQFLPQ